MAPGGGGGRGGKAKGTPPPSVGGGVGEGGARSLASLSESEPATYYTAAPEFESSRGSSPVGSSCASEGGGGWRGDVEAEGEGASGDASLRAPPQRGASSPSVVEAVVASSPPAPSVVVESAAAPRARSATTAAVTEPPSRGGWWWSRRPAPSSGASMTDDSRPDDDDDFHAVDDVDDDGVDGGGGGGGGSAAAPAAAPWVSVRGTPRSSFWAAAFFGRSLPWTSAGSNGGGGGGSGVGSNSGSRGWGRSGGSGTRAGGESGRRLRAAAAAAAARTSPPVSLALSAWEPQSDVPAFGLSPSVPLPPPGARAGPVDLGGVAASLASDDAGDEDEEEDESLSVDGGSACATPVAAGRAGWGGDDPGTRLHRGGGADHHDESSGIYSGSGSGSAPPPPSSMRVRKTGRAATKPADLFSLEDDVQAEAAAAAAAEDAEDVHPRRESMASYETRDTSSLASKPRVKLEVLRASDIKGVHQVLFSSIALGILYMLIAIVLSNTVYVSSVPIKNEQGIDEPVRYYQASKSFLTFEVIFSTIVFVLPALLLVVFALRIWRLPRAERTHEQLWVLLLFCSTLLYLNPVYSIVILEQDSPVDSVQKTFQEVSRWNTEWGIRSTVFVSYVYFYVWMSVHSYRIMRGRLRPSFYAPKILVLTLFGTLRVVVGVYGRIYLGYLPFTSFIASLMLLKKGISRQAYDFFLILLITVYEAGLIAWIFYEVSLTRKTLARTSYMRYRSKQIGFRFLLFHVISSFGSLFFINVLLIVTFPSEPIRLVKERLSLHFLGEQPGKLASDIILFVFLAQESWVNLPADAYGLRGWFAPPAPEPTDASLRLGESYCFKCCWGSDGGRSRPIGVEEMFTYRQREPPAGRHVSPRCLVMDTTVLMFNMAWIAYSYGTPRKRRRQPADYGRDDHVIARYAIGRRTDTHALVVDAPDRIIVAFKGSTNLADLRTDISVFTVDIETVLALPLSGAPRTGVDSTPTDDTEEGTTPDGKAGAGGDCGDDQARAADAAAVAAAAGGVHGDGGDLPPSSNPNPSPTPTSGGAPISSAPSSSTGSRYLRAAMRQASWFSRASDKLRGRATVHTGFSSAYLSVRREVVESVMALYRDRPRPIWLTGHSLGGALATLCSYDLARRVAVPAEEISVVTFGAPRVGNAAFREVYNSLIPRHWRVVLASDVVTKLPKLGYLHVGNQALLTNEAQLFIDPSFVELKWFHWKDTSIRTHRKGNYISAMQAWCRTEHGTTYAPDFWLERGGQKIARAKGTGRGGGDRTAKGGEGTKAEIRSSASMERRGAASEGQQPQPV